MSVKDPFQQLVDEITLIRQDMERLKRTSLDKEDAEALHEMLAEGVDRMRKVGPEVQKAVEMRLLGVAAVLREETTKAAASAAEGAIEKTRAESLEAARSLSQAAGEARRQAWRYFGGFWVWLTSMLATGAVLAFCWPMAWKRPSRPSRSMIWCATTAVDRGSVGRSWTRTTGPASAPSGSDKRRKGRTERTRPLSQAISRRTNLGRCGLPGQLPRFPHRSPA